MDTIPAAIAAAAGKFGDGPALAEPGGPRMSYHQLLHQTTILARALIAEGVTPGERVAIWSPNTHHWVVGAFGALSAGATLVPVSTRFTGPEALDVISRSGASVLIVADRFLSTDRLAALRAAAEAQAAEAARADATSIRTAAEKRNLAAGPVTPGKLRLVVRVPVPDPVEPEIATGPEDGVISWAELLNRADTVPASAAEQRAAAVRPDDVSDILFTSGTTGRSKGAMTAHRQSLAVARAWAERGCLTSNDRYLVVNPFFHSFGFKAGILACLVSGATLVPQLVYDAGRAMSLVASERITVLPGPPTIYQTILDHPERGAADLSSLRLAVTGAASVPVALIERMRRELSFEAVLTAYGLTEAVVATMCHPGDDPQTVATTSGRAAAGFDVRICGPNGDEAKPGDPGEILLRGPNLMLGYLDDPSATSAAIDAQGWLHTGDIGRLDADGYLTITDRLKDMYICGGFNVYPAEVEQVLARLVAARTTVGEGIGPAVRRACLVSAIVLAVIVVPLAAAAGPVADRLFGGDTAMVAVLAGACAALAVTAVSRGTLAGLGAFRGYSFQLATDGGLRAALACALGLMGSRSAVAFGLVLTVAPLLAVLATLGPLLASPRPGPALPASAMRGRLALLIGTMLLAQILINAAVISVRLLSPGNPAVVGALLAAAVLARAPLFVFTSLQTSLLPGLADAVAAGDPARFRHLLTRSCGVVVVLGVAGGLVTTILGPWLTHVLFAARPVLANAVFAWLAAGTLCYMLAMVLGQGAMALSRHREQLLSWLAGVAVLAVVTTAPSEVTVRVVAAYAAGCATVAVVLAIVLVRHSPLTGQHVRRRAPAWPTANQ